MSYRGRTVTACALGLATVACVLPHEMERAGPPGGRCPVSSEPPSVNAPPDTTALRWYRPAAEGDRRRGARWCETVGPPVHAGAPAAPFGELRVGDSLAVVSWNGRFGAGDLVALLTDELGIECDGRRSVLRPGFPAFVLLLQAAVRRSADLPRVTSVGPTVPRAADPSRDAPAGGDVVDAAEACGLALHYVPSTRNGPDNGPRPAEDRGNAILATLPLTIPIALELPPTGERAVAVAATIVLPGAERVRLVSAHVHGVSTLALTLATGNQTRTRQVEGLIDGLDEADDDGPLNAATLVGGDFATWDDHETALLRMLDAFPESPAWDGLSTRGPFAPDHVFFRRGSFRTITVGAYVRLERPYGSSHHGRRVVLNYFPLRVG